MRARPVARASIRGANAAVVGVLGAALYDLVWTSAILTSRDFVVAQAAFVLLTAAAGVAMAYASDGPAWTSCATQCGRRPL